MAGSVNVLEEAHGDSWSIYQADCIDFARQMPDASIGFLVFSPPFSSLYIYSDSIRDLGNTDDDDQFIEQYRFLARELYRITKPGRMCAVHCKDLVYYKNQRGTAGLRDFPGALIQCHKEEGWDYHCKRTIWKCPVNEMQKTKAHGLLYKQLRTDSTFSRCGLPEYLIWFRKWSKEDEEVEPVPHAREDFPLDQWQEWASPVWMDIRQTDVLNVKQARDDRDEKHICPLQLDLIERAVVLSSNPGDVVFSPFMGIGSEGVVALKLGRRFIGTELKDSYFRIAKRNLEDAERDAATPDLFDLMAGLEDVA
jgi:DNA modification methylase